eukprot:CAMPEP_0202339820 /NCGR_PEP_ID=MMETSP1126-20121109/1516_1 /ASSEMBLY_ACC=CAM_ASM_000457 /TAXON_ID=3047 /ORGANISM="Dunaliella tertiolecta, Strain CCMP1320" /LENGTH=867 /DNA_ID=CAMNT_0048930421 /DNA_START=98 /DNA_END=2701 /DNA_ORIENTATION=-
MDEEQQRERFDLDNDYEGGEFIGGEFYYRKKRSKRQQTEEDRLYGVFADGSDSDDDRRSRKRERADYSAPVSFVSKGTAGSAEQAPKDEEVRPSFATTGPAAAGAGLGAGGGHGGLGFTSAGPANQQGQEEDEEEESVLPTAFGARIKAKAAKRRQEEQQQKKQETQRQASQTADPEFGTFERFTKGIGMKLLQKMGYKPGEGLGREKKTGIAKPVEAKMRPKKVGMGFGVRHQDSDDESAQQRTAQGPQATQQAPQQQKATWRKKNKDVRVQREYKSAAEVLAAAPAKPLAAQPILDMRGPQARLITNLEHLNVQAEDESAKAPMPELQHNLQLLVDLAEADIQKLDAKLRHEQDTAALLVREKKRLEDEATLQAEQLERLGEVLQEVSRCAALPGDPNALSLQQVEAVYSSLLKTYREEYMLYNLAGAALSHAMPRLSAALQGWSPLADPQRCVADFRRWRPLLEPSGHTAGGGTALFAASGAFGNMDGAGGAADAQDPYLLLVSEAVLPPLRAACTTWEPRDPEALLTFLEAWEPVLPRAALQHILDMLVMPRLRAAVTQWEPRQETVPIHAWLHPWLPFLGSALEELYPVIRHKLGVALQAWHPSDSSALVLLRPWHRVFDASEWDALLLRCIVPKLAMALQAFAVNPVAQDMAPFQWVMGWNEVLPHHHMAALLDVGFFPKWHQVLHYWLSHTPNYDEVTAWYLGWKAAFPPGLLDHERVRRQFNAALNMMNTAVDGTVLPMPSVAPTSAYSSRWAADLAEAAAGAAPAAAAPGPTASKATAAAMGMGASTELTLRDLVQRFAEEYSIQFLPKFGRFQDGQQVYSFGSTSIVLDNVHSTIRALVRDRWAPVTLETLLQQSLK